MKYLTFKNAPILALLISGGLLAGAHFFEHVLGYEPCQMCLWQRWAHWGVVAIALFALLLRTRHAGLSRLLTCFVPLSLLVSAGIAFWHMGVEYGWIAELKSCSAGDLQPASEMQLPTSLGDLNDVKLSGCGVVPWKMGLSMAGWNVVISIFGFILTSLAIRGGTQGGENV